jgi:hypothetical protein
VRLGGYYSALNSGSNIYISGIEEGSDCKIDPLLKPGVGK